MKASLQDRIAPPVVQNHKDFGDAQTIESPRAIDSNAATRTDFRDLLSNSNAEAIKEREAIKNGDLSGAKTETEFLEKLAKRNEPVRVPKNNLDKDDFLKLFVTQLQNQDPLNPDDSTEMASKLAHFNSLEQMLNVNKTLDKLFVAQSSDRQMRMIDYVGKEITVNGGRIRLKDGQPSESIFSLPTASTETTLQVRDAAGVIALEKSLGSMPMGEQKFTWDGKGVDGKRVSDGVYTYSLIAKSIDGQDIPVQTHSRVKILGVDIQDSTGSVYTDFGKVKLQDIVAVGSPGFEDKTGIVAPPSEQQTNAFVTPPGTPSPAELQQLLQTQLAKTSSPSEGEGKAGDQPATATENLPKPDYSMQTDPASGMMPSIATNVPSKSESATQTNEDTAKPAAADQPRSM